VSGEREAGAKKIRLPKHAGEPFRIVVRGQDARFFDDLYHRLLACPWWQFFALAAIGFLVINALFACAFLAQPGAVFGARAGSFEDAFFFSVQTFATIGYGAMSPLTFFGHCVVTFEAFVGLVSVALMTGITFAKFSRPRARILFSEKFVISKMNGVPHLMFRMANWRGNLIVEAQLHVIVLVQITSPEGHSLRRPVDLKLVRDRNPTFVLTWTAMHAIDEGSPFFGVDPITYLHESDTQIVLSLTGLDETAGQQIHARYSYGAKDAVMDMRFVDVVTLEKDGTRIIDYARFHDVQPNDDEGASA
jgi:inward rectifier potassium channel